MNTPKPTDFHKAPRGFEGPCPICGFDGNQNGEHRAVDPSEGIEARFIRRYKTAAGWKFKAVGTEPPPPKRKPRRKPAPKPRPRRGRDTSDTREKVVEAATMAAKGKTRQEIADTFGVGIKTVDWWRMTYIEVWEHAKAVAMPAPPEPPPKPPQSGPTDETLQRVAEAAALTAQGLGRGQIAKTLDVKVDTIKRWKSRHKAVWTAAYRRAMLRVVRAVRAAAGTDAVLEDPDGHIVRANTAKRWLEHKGEALFPAGDKMTLPEFYRQRYEPLRLADATEETRYLYRMVLQQWEILVGPVPLEEITVDILAKYRDCLKRMKGLRSYERMRPVTIRSKLRHIQTVLGFAGPRGPRQRDCCGILTETPWIRPPPNEVPVPKMVALEDISACYQAAVCMESPRVDGFRASVWWRTLLVVSFNLGLRHRTLMQIRMDNIDFEKQMLAIPPSNMKNRRAQVLHLNQTVMDHLLRFRSRREKLFPWPHNRRTFWYRLHRLQYEAGIPRERYFGLHGLRRTAATLLWQDNPQAAQLLLGHSSMNMTISHYVDSTRIVSAAVDAMPQPAAFGAP